MSVFKRLTVLFIGFALLPRVVLGQQDSLQPKAIIVTTKPVISVQAGLVYSLLKQDRFHSNANLGYSAGLSFKRNLDEHTFVLLAFNYQHLVYNNMQTDLYDIGYQVEVNLSTSISFDEMETPLVYGFEKKGFSIAAGIAPAYLFRAVLNQTPYIDPSHLTGTLMGKYARINRISTAPFYRFNLSPCLVLGYRISKRFAVNWVCGYELIRNPLTDYSDFRPFNFLNNTLFLTFKLN